MTLWSDADDGLARYVFGYAVPDAADGSAGHGWNLLIVDHGPISKE